MVPIGTSTTRSSCTCKTTGKPRASVRDVALGRAHEGAVDPDMLAAAIAATFARRGTPLPAGLPLGLADEFARDRLKQSQWNAFLSKNRLEAPPLDVVMSEVRSFLEAPLARASRQRG